jgi:hypothetical protein
MRKNLIHLALALALCAPVLAQSREITDSGTYVLDAAGTYVRLEGADGVIVTFLYDEGETSETSGISVRVNANVTLTVRYDDHDGFAVAGLPVITSRLGHEGRTTSIRADGDTVARFDYAPSGLFAAATLPGRLTWKVSAPDASGRIRQSVENAGGMMVASAMMKGGYKGIRHRLWYDAAVADLGLPVDSLTYALSPTGALQTVRDAEGRVVFYVVHTADCDVGFSPDGTPLFYDLTLSVYGGTVPPDSDLKVSPTWDSQAATVPDHLVLTASGTVGLYTANVKKHGIVTAWAGRDGKVCVVQAEDDTPAAASR